MFDYLKIRSYLSKCLEEIIGIIGIRSSQTGVTTVRKASGEEGALRNEL